MKMIAIVLALVASLTQPKDVKLISLMLEPTPTPEVTITYSTPTPTPKPRKSWVGVVSYYSEDGCLGCNPELIMANGQKFRNDGMTIAFNKLPLNTKVKLTNLDNSKSVYALVTDRGGFERLGRLADLSPAVMRALDAKTDVSKIKIEEVVNEEN